MVIRMPVIMNSDNSNGEGYVLVDDDDYDKCKQIK